MRGPRSLAHERRHQVNFWTFLDRNGHGIGLICVVALAIIGPALAERITGHPSEGCRLRCGSSEQAPSASEKR